MSSLNLTGSYFGNDVGFAQQNQPGLMETKSRAVLYVFKPYQNQFSDVGLRPFQYRFDENFIAGTQEITDLAKRGTMQAGVIIEDLMSRNNLNDYMLPSYSPTMQFRASQLADRWRFILVLTEAASDLSIGNTVLSTSPSSQMRRIYSGFFEDEPFNTTNFGGKRTLNPHSYMVITHKTVVGTATSHGRLGPETSLNTFVSEEIVHPTVSQNLTINSMGDNTLHLMTPDNCVNSIDSTDDGYSIAVPGAHSDISRDTGANVVSDFLEQPAHNVAQIVKGMIRYQDDFVHRNRLSTRRVGSYFDDEFIDESLQRTKLARYMSLPRARRAGAFDLDENDRISPVDLDNMVSGELDVVDFDLERPQYYETADQLETSVTNQYSFLIASVISPIMNSAGLNEMQFEFQIARRNGQVHESFRTYSAAPNWPVPQHDLMSMAKAVEIELSRGIFATIFESKGDFHVTVSANATGMTVVRLSLVGQGYRNPVDFELPSCMGGLITPLLGDSASNATNSEAIETLYNVATGSASIGRSFNQDDRDFMNYAQSNALTYDESEMQID